MSKDDHEDLKSTAPTSTRALDLRTDEEKKEVTTELQRLQKVDKEAKATTRSLLLEQAIRFILNSRKPITTGTQQRGPVDRAANMTNAQWEQIEELLDQ